MKFADFVCQEAIRAQLAAEDKETVIRELVGALVESGKVATSDSEDIVRAIIKREELGSTGIGRGVAVPHTKHPSVERLVGTVGISTRGSILTAWTGRRCSCYSCWCHLPIDRETTCVPWRTSRGSCGTTCSANSLSRPRRVRTFVSCWRKPTTTNSFPDEQASVARSHGPTHCHQDGNDRQPAGLHARPADLFVKLANRFSAKIWVSRGKNHESVDGKSILSILTLGAEQGTRLEIIATGEDAAAAVAALSELVEQGFAVDPGWNDPSWNETSDSSTSSTQ